VLVLLPPSETKASGGKKRPLDLDSLSFPDLTPIRRKLLDALTDLAADPIASISALGLSPRQEHETVRNRELWSSPTRPALERYTGVLYEAFDFAGMAAAVRARVKKRILIASALFGVVRSTDHIPAYRLSGGNTLPSLGPLRTLWQPVLQPTFAGMDELIVDLRSGTYATLTRIPQAITVQVVTEDAVGVRKTVSHHNKAYKGKLAAALTSTGRDPSTIEGVATKASRAGFIIERSGERELTLITGE